jgi:phosphoribosylaminoimidazole carboxylase PurE protein
MKISVAILMGSKTDLPVVEEGAKILKEFGVLYEMRVLSAHRTPKEVVKYVEALPSRGAKVVIGAAGGSAALAGTIAAHTQLPVIGIPVDSTSLLGLDALLSTAQMPPGVPVACVAVGKMGAKNAAFLALRILALLDSKLAVKLDKYREEEKKKILNITLN